MKWFKLVIISIIILIFSSCFKPNKGIKISCINVGEGDSILIQYNNKNFLIDGGPLDGSDKLLKYIKSNRIKNFSCIFITHPHEDHIGGLPKILSKYKVHDIFSSGSASNSPAYVKLTNLIKQKGVKAGVLKNDDKIIIDKNFFFQILSSENSNKDNLNNNSLVIKLTYCNNTFLFMGDAEKEIEDNLLESKFNLRSDVIKIAHHGSSTSTSDDFLDAVSPKIALISCGLNNSFNHPSKIIINRLKSRNVIFFRTDIDGTIELYSDGNKIKH
ncbi:MAG: MBL fold metallo-hydrolase [Bacillota bacterium]|nr:MBL fold metallo-hydrolase [Bacillota bacterium]